MSITFTKEMGVAAAALVVALVTVGARLEETSANVPWPDIPPIEDPLEPSLQEVSLTMPRLVAAPPTAGGRNPFLAASVWLEPVPAPLGLPPERPQRSVIPVVAIGGGRARTPLAPPVPQLPSLDPEDEEGGEDDW